MSKKLNIETTTQDAATKTQPAPKPGTFEKPEMTWNGTLLADSHTAAFMKWRKSKEA